MTCQRQFARTFEEKIVRFEFRLSFECVCLLKISNFFYNLAMLIKQGFMSFQISFNVMWM